MAFFDKLNTLAKNVGDKANDAIEITKLNGKINSEKVSIAEDYRKIGEFYYVKYASGQTVDAEIAEFLASIDSHNAAIQEAEMQLKSVREEPVFVASGLADTVKCPSCGKANAAGTKFCSECGSKLEAPVAPEPRVCKACGAAVAEGIKFCGECGAKME